MEPEALNLRRAETLKVLYLQYFRALGRACKAFKQQKKHQHTSRITLKAENQQHYEL